MQEPALAAKFNTILKILSLYKKRTLPAMNEISYMRAKHSQLVGRFNLQDNKENQHRRHHRNSGVYWKEYVYQEQEEQPLELFYLHGGGLVFYDVEDYESLLRYWSKKARINITGFGYPKAPETDYSVIIRGLREAFIERLSLVPHHYSVYLVGDSVGAYMALQLSQASHLRNFKRIILINPLLETYGQRPSFYKYSANYLLDEHMLSWFRHLLSQNISKDMVFDTFSLKKIRSEIHIYSAEFDMLRDESFAWKDYLNNLKVKVHHHHFMNLPHDFCLYAGYVPEAKEAVDKIAESFSL